MPKSIPLETPITEVPPIEPLETPDIPPEKKLKIVNPDQTELKDEIPEESPKIETTPEPSPNKEEMPSELNEENCVVVNGKKIEIKPTKLKYFRNKGASAYGIIKAIPLHELLTYDKGVIDPKRDADQLLFDFLVAVFDDSSFVATNYNEMDADTIDRIVKIFGRINHVDEKEEAARKNKEAQATKR